MSTNGDVLQSQLHEVRRGSVVVATLVLCREEQYGYALIEQLAEVGIETDANTLYPLLRRLEKQGLLESDWNTTESRPRKYYRTTSAGEAMGQTLIAEWSRLSHVLGQLNGENQ